MNGQDVEMGRGTASGRFPLCAWPMRIYPAVVAPAIARRVFCLLSWRIATTSMLSYGRVRGVVILDFFELADCWLPRSVSRPYFVKLKDSRSNRVPLWVRT